MVLITYTVPTNQCSGTGLQITNTAPAQTGSPGVSGSWQFTVGVQNCTGGDLHNVKAQGGTSASITVTVNGTVPKNAACGLSLPISGVWTATGLDATNTEVAFRAEPGRLDPGGLRAVVPRCGRRASPGRPPTEQRRYGTRRARCFEGE